MRRAERAAVLCQIFNRQFDSLAPHTGVEPLQRGAQSRHQHNFMLRLAPQYAVLTRLLMESVDGLVAKPDEQGNGRLLYQGVFGIFAHGLYLIQIRQSCKAAWYLLVALLCAAVLLIAQWSQV